MSGYTPGPWVARAQGNGDMLVATVCQVADWFVGPEFEDAYSVSYDEHGAHEDDAKLIAAAPELYEALRELLASVRCANAAPDENGEWTRDARIRYGNAREIAFAAIAKAEGV
jgi:hypothetical protein